MIFTLLAWLFLGGSLFLFIRNNELFAHGGRYLMHPDALVMLGVLGIPFILVLLHLVRALQQHRRSRTHDAASHSGKG
jgi:DMSO reductase anchor subunit